VPITALTVMPISCGRRWMNVAFTGSYLYGAGFVVTLHQPHIATTTGYTIYGTVVLQVAVFRSRNFYHWVSILLSRIQKLLADHLRQCQ
jgi:hypothetical protein